MAQPPVGGGREEGGGTWVETGGVSRAGQRTVLVVEDDRTLGDLVHTVLADEGYAVSLLSDVRTESVRAAVARLEPDCILLDGADVEGYGRSWEDATWAHTRSRPIPVVMFTVDAAATAEAVAAESARSREAAYFAVLAKPFKLDELLDVVARAVGAVWRFDGSAPGESSRAAALEAKLAAAGARDIEPSFRREWATFRVGDTLCLLYWSHRDGVYYVLHQERRGGSMQEVGRFGDLDLAVELAVASVGDDVADDVADGAGGGAEAPAEREAESAAAGATRPSGVGSSTRYEVRWDASRKGYAIFDTALNAWAVEPAFGLEHIASGMAESMNQREAVREQRRWLTGEDRARDKK